MLPSLLGAPPLQPPTNPHTSTKTHTQTTASTHTYLSNRSILPKDVVELIRGELKRQIAHIQHASDLRGQTIAGAEVGGVGHDACVLGGVCVCRCLGARRGGGVAEDGGVCM